MTILTWGGISLANEPLNQSAKHWASPVYARTYSVEETGSYTLLRVHNPWQGAHRQFAYALYDRNGKKPDIPPDVVGIGVPVQKMVVTSTTLLGFFDQLDVLDRVSGISQSKLVTNQRIRQLLDSGTIREVGAGVNAAGELNMERMYAMAPDVVFAFGTGNPRFDLPPKLAEAGFPMVVCSEYMETTPLGRAEWIKFLSLFFNKEQEAAEHFAAICSAYEKTAAMAAGTKKRPRVFCNMDYEGVWHVPGGQSFMAKYLADAGADYLWKEEASMVAIPLSVEAVMARAQNADIWLHPGPARSLTQVLGRDVRYSVFSAFLEGEVYNNTVKVNEYGGNDAWETGVVRPDLVLADLVKIFHPKLLPDHRLIWYEKLTE